MHYRLILFILGISLSSSLADQVKKSGQSLNLQIDTLKQNVLINGLNGRTYAIIGNGEEESIKITCAKSCVINGTISAGVNGSPASKNVPCSSYAAGSTNEFYCLNQEFSSTLRTDCLTSYDVSCTLLESSKLSDTTTFSIQRLFADNIPRIRADDKIDPAGPLSFHFIDQEAVSCEAIRDSCAGTVFDKVEWFAPDGSNLNTPVNKSDITDKYTSFSTPFPASQDIKCGQPYKCCTTLNGCPVNCQSLIPLITVKTTTPAPAPTDPPTPPPTHPATNPPTHRPSSHPWKPKPCTICSAGVKPESKLFGVIFMNVCMLIATRFK